MAQMGEFEAALAAYDAALALDPEMEDASFNRDLVEQMKQQQEQQEQEQQEQQDSESESNEEQSGDESEESEELWKILKGEMMMELLRAKQQRMQYETQPHGNEVDPPKEPLRIRSQLVHPYLPTKISLTAICTRS